MTAQMDRCSSLPFSTEYNLENAILVDGGIKDFENKMKLPIKWFLVF
jgi:hypothetical protein